MRRESPVPSAARPAAMPARSSVARFWPSFHFPVREDTAISKADDRRQHALDVARRCIGYLPGLDAVRLVAIGQGFEKAAQPHGVLVPRNGALCVHHGVVPGRHDLAVRGLGGIPAWAYVVIRALEDCERWGPAGDHAPDGVGARDMSAEHTVRA